MATECYEYERNKVRAKQCVPVCLCAQCVSAAVAVAVVDLHFYFCCMYVCKLYAVRLHCDRESSVIIMTMIFCTTVQHKHTKQHSHGIHTHMPFLCIVGMTVPRARIHVSVCVCVHIKAISQRFMY